MRLNHLRLARRLRRGLSIVEMLVGIAIGMFILAGATMVVTGQLSDNRLLLLETQVQQDLRATADIIARDIRRAGYWGNAADAVWPAPGAVVPVNPYRGLWEELGNGRTELMYSRSDSLPPLSPPPIGENDVEDAAERFGFALDAATGVLEMQIGAGGWQALTDANVLEITQFAAPVAVNTLVVPCAKECPGVGGTACWPRQQIRSVTVAITGRARHDAAVQRSVGTTVRLRNDGVIGTCPA